jgi:hypothetical protein
MFWQRALELLVARHPCVMLLYELDLPRRPLMAQPLVKLRKVHENEFSNCFHRGSRFLVVILIYKQWLLPRGFTTQNASHSTTPK